MSGIRGAMFSAGNWWPCRRFLAPKRLPDWFGTLGFSWFHQQEKGRIGVLMAWPRNKRLSLEDNLKNGIYNRRQTTKYIYTYIYIHIHIYIYIYIYILHTCKYNIDYDIMLDFIRISPQAHRSAIPKWPYESVLWISRIYPDSWYWYQIACVLLFSLNQDVHICVCNEVMLSL